MSTPADIALHRTGGGCACGCGRAATEIRFVFEPEDYPELATHPDNVVALATTCRLTRRVCRHAELLADDDDRRAYLRSRCGR